MKESYDLSRCLVDRSKVAPFTAIADEAGPCQIFFRRFAAMLYGDDVVWLMWQEGIVFMKKAIIHICDRRAHESAGEVLLAHIRSSVPRFLVAHVSGLSPCASKVQLARIGPVRA